VLNIGVAGRDETFIADRSGGVVRVGESDISIGRRRVAEFKLYLAIHHVDWKR
jgi:uncharacterized protein (DUF1499 family)